MSPRALDDDELRLLRALADEAVQGRGWSRRNERGWRFTDEFTAYPLVVHHMKNLVSRGYARRDDVLDPARSTPLYLNRITVRGEDYLGGTGGWVPRPIREPGELTTADRESLFITREAWEGLVALTGMEEDDGWVLAIEVGNRTGSSFFRSYADTLISRGLAESRPAPGDLRAARGALQYRATSLGRAALLIDGETSERRVQVRVPGIRLRAPIETRRGPGPTSGG